MIERPPAAEEQEPISSARVMNGVETAIPDWAWRRVLDVALRTISRTPLIEKQRVQCGSRRSALLLGPANPTNLLFPLLGDALPPEHRSGERAKAFALRHRSELPVVPRRPRQDQFPEESSRSL